ncbi:hypothetical protein K461DRAFT_271436 [Myriangium duriaei CBS 260.36]|uniref:Uncharacterized protein n=1 Tax=Myriangium duriaei CBS 260.36 TaxID=1168546 RepID=A0A9P4IXU6_9PEZI|nr:hypothetical protein K461DRAFT_271436 [Myriangium duriaei CBS 260.36]
MLALASLQIAVEDAAPTDVMFYVNQTLQLQSRSASAAIAILAPQLPNSPDSETRSAAECVLISCRYTTMLAHVLQVGKKWRTHGLFAVAAVNMVDDEEIDLTASGALANLKQLIAAKKGKGVVSDGIAGMYGRALSCFEFCFIKSKRDTIGWFTMVGDEFVDEINRKDDVARLIFLYWGALLFKTKWMWWAKFIAVRLVDQESQDICRSKDDLWDRDVNWARSEVWLLPQGAELTTTTSKVFSAFSVRESSIFFQLPTESVSKFGASPDPILLCLPSPLVDILVPSYQREMPARYRLLANTGTRYQGAATSDRLSLFPSFGTDMVRRQEEIMRCSPNTTMVYVIIGGLTPSAASGDACWEIGKEVGLLGWDTVQRDSVLTHHRRHGPLHNKVVRLDDVEETRLGSENLLIFS